LRISVDSLTRSISLLPSLPLQVFSVPSFIVVFLSTASSLSYQFLIFHLLSIKYRRTFFFLPLFFLFPSLANTRGSFCVGCEFKLIWLLNQLSCVVKKSEEEENVFIVGCVCVSFVGDLCGEV
jgi:hypothetical protein